MHTFDAPGWIGAPPNDSRQAQCDAYCRPQLLSPVGSCIAGTRCIAVARTQRNAVAGAHAGEEHRQQWCTVVQTPQDAGGVLS